MSIWAWQNKQFTIPPWNTRKVKMEEELKTFHSKLWTYVIRYSVSAVLTPTHAEKTRGHVSVSVTQSDMVRTVISQIMQITSSKLWINTFIQNCKFNKKQKDLWAVFSILEWISWNPQQDKNGNEDDCDSVDLLQDNHAESWSWGEKNWYSARK